MKFQHLQIGQRFEYEGEVYVKSSPLVANHDTTGKAKMIPRWAVLTPLDGQTSEAPAASPDKPVPAAEVRALLKDFEQQCLGVLAGSDLDEALHNELAERFASLRQRLLRSRGLDGT